MIKVAKFGGTSLSNAAQFRKAAEIVREDPARRFIVVSAPGKRNQVDQKITDLLYLVAKGGDKKNSQREAFNEIGKRYLDIVKDLGIDLDLKNHLEEIWEKITKRKFSADYAASRGEYLSGLIMASLLDFEFVDACDVIRFDAEGRYDALSSRKKLAKIKKLKNAVIPGFYGARPNGRIKTFSRGGSDVTGAIVAEAIGADLYENWTDVSGIFRADPRIVDNPKKIKTITYRELRELAYMGASVLHDEAVFPVREKNIPIQVRNTNRPEDKGTLIIPDENNKKRAGTIVGIAGRKDFTVIKVEKTMMNQEIGFVKKICVILERHGVSFEHMPSGIDTLSIVIDERLFKDKIKDVVKEIKRECKPNTIEIYPGMAMISTVGRAMAHTVGLAAKLCGAVAEAGINLRMINQGSSEISIIVGVENKDSENAIRAIYKAFTD